jgi:hypothetical protein
MTPRPSAAENDRDRIELAALPTLPHPEIVFFATIPLAHVIVAFICAIWEICGSRSLPSEQPSSCAGPTEEKTAVGLTL